MEHPRNYFWKLADDEYWMLISKVNFIAIAAKEEFFKKNVLFWNAWLAYCKCFFLRKAGKFYRRSYNIKVNSIETGRIVIADFLSWGDLEKCMYTKLFQLMIVKFYRRYLIYKYNFTYSLFWTTRKLTKDTKII